MASTDALGFLTAMDGTAIPYRAWGKDTSRSALVLLHGAGPYSRWYEALGRQLADADIGTFVFDQRGFGETPGPRGHCRRFSLYLDDCGLALSAAAARWPSANVTLCGHSFGGLVALRYCVERAAKRGPMPHTLVLLAPWIKDTLKVPYRMLAAGLFNAFLRPAKAYRVPITVFQTGDPQNVDALNECDRDEKCVHEVTARWFLVTSTARFNLLRGVRRLRLPVLQIEGTNDTLLDRDTNRRLFIALGSEDKHLVVLPGVFHDAQLQLDVQSVARPIVDFLKVDQTTRFA